VQPVIVIVVAAREARRKQNQGCEGKAIEGALGSHQSISVSNFSPTSKHLRDPVRTRAGSNGSKRRQRAAAKLAKCVNASQARACLGVAECRSCVRLRLLALVADAVGMP